MVDILSGPLTQKCYELCLEIESLTASEQQTKCSILCSNLNEAIAQLERRASGEQGGADKEGR